MHYLKNCTVENKTQLEQSAYLVQVYVVGVVHDRRRVLGEQLAHHGAVRLAVDVGHGVLQHLVQLRLLHLWRRQQLALQQLLSGGPQGRVVGQQPLDHLPLTDTKKRRRDCSFRLGTQEEKIQIKLIDCVLRMFFNLIVQ